MGVGEGARGGHRPDGGDSNDLAAALRADPVSEPYIRKLVEDHRFKASIAELDIKELTEEFQRFTDSITRYNDFHRRERRLWAIKLGKGKIPANLEEAFKREAPVGKQTFKDAFRSADRCLEIAEQSAFKPLVNEHVREIGRRFMFDENTVIGEAADLYFRRIGCSTPMIEEFKHHFRPINYDFIGALAGADVSNLRPLLRDGVKAQEEILDYTEQHGLDYLRGGRPTNVGHFGVKHPGRSRDFDRGVGDRCHRRRHHDHARDHLCHLLQQSSASSPGRLRAACHDWFDPCLVPVNRRGRRFGLSETEIKAVARLAIPARLVVELSDAATSSTMETCGPLLGRVRRSRITVLEWCRCICQSDEATFEVPVRMLLTAEHRLRTVGIFHTHPAAPAVLSAIDFWSIANSPFAWLIAGVSLDGRPQLRAYRPRPVSALEVEVRG